MTVFAEVLKGVCILAVAMSWAAVPPTARHLGLFAQVYELEVTSTNRRLLTSYIMWIRAWRIGGAVVVYGVLGVWALVGTTKHDWGWGPIAIGYALGGAVGEWRRPRPQGTGPRRASLRPRSITEYVRPWVLLAIGACSVIAVACTAIYASMDAIDAERGRSTWYPSPLTMAAVIAGALALTAAILWLGAHIARRPQPAGQPDIDAVHHAIRSSSLVSLSGLALMSSAVGAGFVAQRVSWFGSDLPWPLRHIGGVGSLVALILAGIGFMLSFRSIPRFAPFRRHVPKVPEPAA